MNLRTVIFWSHLAAGVVAGLVILVMSSTGVLLMYERQLVAWSDRGYRSAPSPGADQRLAVETLVERVQAQRPADRVTAITLRSDPAAPAAVTLGQTTVYADVYAGRILGEPSTGIRRAMASLKSWHRWVGMEGERRVLGKTISGWSNGVFLAIVLSGMYLWIPRRWNWNSVRAVTMFRRGLRSRARDFNWHNVVGVWSAVPLAIVIATAMPMSFRWANAMVYAIVGESAPAAGGGEGASRPDKGGNRQPTGSVSTPGSMNALWNTAERQMPDWRSISFRIPASPQAPAVFAIDSGNGGQPQRRATLTLDAASGNVVSWETFATQSPGRRLRSWTRFTHTGEYYGIVGQTIAGLASAGGVVLVCTGLALAWRRFFARFLAGITAQADHDEASRAA